MTITWNGVTLQNPTVADKAYVTIGGSFTVASGAQVFDIQTTKNLITLHWEALTTSQKNAIVNLGTAYNSYSLDLTNVGYGSAINVMPQPGTLKVSPEGVLPLWSVDVQVRET